MREGRLGDYSPPQRRVLSLSPEQPPPPAASSGQHRPVSRSLTLDGVSAAPLWQVGGPRSLRLIPTSSAILGAAQLPSCPTADRMDSFIETAPRPGKSCMNPTWRWTEHAVAVHESLHSHLSQHET